VLKHPESFQAGEKLSFLPKVFQGKHSEGPDISKYISEKQAAWKICADR
jgi:hypothetical protein